MGMFNKLFKKDNNESEDTLSAYDIVKNMGIQNYKMEHFDVCRDIWKNKVPKSGQAETLQGELLRQVEKLRNEACDNGNINWDDNYEWFCDFISKTLEESHLYDDEYLDKIKTGLSVIKECGIYADRFNSGEIPEDKVDPLRFAYTEDDFYDYIEDAIAVFAINNKDIPYEKKDYIYR